MLAAPQSVALPLKRSRRNIGRARLRRAATSFAAKTPFIRALSRFPCFLDFELVFTWDLIFADLGFPGIAVTRLSNGNPVQFETNDVTKQITWAAAFPSSHELAATCNYEM